MSWKNFDPVTVFDQPKYSRPSYNVPLAKQPLYVDASGATQFSQTVFDYSVGNDGRNGRSWDRAFLTMSEALDNVKTGGTIYFRGDIREELVGSNLKFDVTIVGCGAQHHPDQPGSTDLYDTGAAMWRPPASPTATTVLLEVRARGWTFVNIAFDCPVDAAAVKLVSNASSGTDEYDASHATFIGCDFQQGKYAIQDAGGCSHVTIKDCTFRMISEASGCAIINTSTSVRLPHYWKIIDCYFPGDGAGGGNETHIDAPLSAGIIKGCVFGTVEGTGLYIDLTGGDDNDVVFNSFAGVYTTGDYVAGTSDRWFGNHVAVISTQAPNGFTITVPAA